jgi:hypothetical protein
MFSKLFGSKPVPLTGAPPVRRQKTYSAQSGYVYQYYYEGQRPTRPERGIEFVFDVSADRKTSTAVSVLVPEEVVESWQRDHGRALNSTERYAIAKMALFQAFDQRESPAGMSAPVRVDAAAAAEILQTLEID